MIHITLMNQVDFRGEAHLCEECAQRFLEAQAEEPGNSRERRVGGSDERQVFVDKVIISEVHDQQVLVFRELEGDRYLPFVLGIFEATIFDRTLRGVASPRPLTHDAWLATIAAIGASVHAGCIYDRHEETYFAELRLAHGPETLTVDLRPSDALVLCLKAGVSFLISERLLAEAQAD